MGNANLNSHKKAIKTVLNHRAPLSELPQIELKNKYQNEIVDNNKTFTTQRKKVLFENSKGYIDLI